MTKVHLVFCCLAEDVKKVMGPFDNEEEAKLVANEVEEHFWNGGDRHIKVESRVVR